MCCMWELCGVVCGVECVVVWMCELEMCDVVVVCFNFVYEEYDFGVV